VNFNLDKFVGIAHTAQEYATLGLSGYPSSKFRMIELLTKERVPRYPSQRRGGGCVYWFHDLSKKWQEDIIAHFHSHNQNEDEIRRELSSKEIDSILYAAAPEYNRKKADKYLSLYNDFSHLRGYALKQVIAKYNDENKEQRTSYARVKAVFKEYEKTGVAAFLGKYGKNLKNSTVPDEAFAYWKSLVLQEGAPSYEYCWKLTLGRFCATKEQLANFPTADAFIRKLRATHNEAQICLARYGKKKWSQKFAFAIDRDWSNVTAGSVWVCDHAQIDVLCLSDKSKAKREKTLAPWYTAWRDFKTGKHLSGDLYEDSPNSDHILQTFYYAALKFGLPETILIDNGKDFRSKDVTGGRKSSKLDAVKATSTMSLLGIKVIFALPYNAQSKPIERDFKNIKEWFSKMLPGYRGGNILERPEKLKHEIYSGKILTFTAFKPLFETFINEVLNKMPSKGKALNGLSPDDLWNKENIIKRRVDKESLKLCCMRSSKAMTIGRHGIKDSEFGVTYFDEWLWNHPRTKVYLRRDPKDFNEAWVFNAETDECMGKAFIRKQIAAFAETPIEKEKLKQAIGIRRRQLKLAKEPGATVIRQSTEVILEDMEAAAKLFGNNVEEQNQNVSELVRTPLDSVALNQRATKKAQQFRNDNEARIFTALWKTDEHGRKIQPILTLDSDFDYYDEHKEELLKMVNG